MNDTLLRLEALSKSFGGLQAVSNLSFDVKAGTHHQPDRRQRRRQDHGVQPDHRQPRARRRAHLFPRQPRRRPAAAQGSARGHRARLPGTAPVQPAERARQHRGRDSRPARREHLSRARSVERRCRDEAKRDSGALRCAAARADDRQRRPMRSPSGSPTASRNCSSLGRLLAAQGELLLLDEPTAGLSPRHGGGLLRPRTRA